MAMVIIIVLCIIFLLFLIGAWLDGPPKSKTLRVDMFLSKRGVWVREINGCCVGSYKRNHEAIYCSKCGQQIRGFV